MITSGYAVNKRAFASEPLPPAPLASSIRCRLWRKLEYSGIDRWGAYVCFGSTNKSSADCGLRIESKLLAERYVLKAQIQR